ncbi:unknown protein (plasmid) [Simkania negevensis Z]|uniref:Uncharacterized protein n=1 Tax=Simkania negevensis (strain ATCC VR-1471 / DSM 27360 / Z) TaxID=331113 RepID=F8L2T4_SIMNZ|nr:unknown protein [Simkania negevensis Z]
MTEIDEVFLGLFFELV